jgi:hypothetical protein
MSTLKATTIEPATGTNVTLGTTGDTVALPGNTLALDTWKDSGGNTLFTSDGSGAVSNVNAGLAGAGPVLIQSQTASGASTVSFTSGIDSTYDRYMFVSVNINPSAEPVEFRFQVSTDGGSGYGINLTSTFFMAHHNPGSGAGDVIYQSSYDEANSTANQALFRSLGSGASESCSGILHLFAPSSTTYVKQFYSTTQGVCYDPQSYECFVAGYFNTTSAIDAVQFSVNTGTFDGTIKLYGVK